MEIVQSNNANKKTVSRRKRRKSLLDLEAVEEAENNQSKKEKLDPLFEENRAEPLVTQQNGNDLVNYNIIKEE